MTVSKDLFLSILAKDSYNRGYGEGIQGLGSKGSKIGTATFTGESDTLPNTAGVDADFFATAKTETEPEPPISKCPSSPENSDNGQP